MWHLLVSCCYYSFVAPFRGKSKLRDQLFPMMANVGARSLAIVSMVAFLTGSVLVLQTGAVMEQFGQIQEVPGLVALAMARELGPLMTAIVLIARVGASYTAVLGSMSINEELVALRTMAIHPVGYLVAPRFLSMLVMMPALVVFSYLLGMLGGALVAWTMYAIPAELYLERTVFYLSMNDIVGGLVKAAVFGLLISIISCYWGLNAGGGPTGLGRNIMVSVVSSLVVVVLADALVTAFLLHYLL
jgi:phospholipid/cholesterol/gamma-HCH transport system permease protein